MNNASDYSSDLPMPLTASSRHHLPALYTSFVGRVRELREIKDLLSTTRLLTLTGIGGIGKTRCALQVAHELVHEDRELFPDCSWFVSLSHLRLSSQIVPAIAWALGRRGEVTRARIDDFLRPKKALLLLDGCEHLIEDCARLPGLVIPQLATGLGIFYLRQQFNNFPRELLDAGVIDGAGTLRMLWSIILPNMRSVLTALAIILFIQTWNEYFWPLLVSGDLHNTTIQVGLQVFLQEDSNAWGALMAAAMLSLLPVLVLYVLAQRQIIAAFVRSGIQ
ncbi:hypothetical protein KDA_48010 [Dictyobacter alpinus]|uniref:ABC transmembrane type-1 domain-containing protein n=1 Tax=Dictyobacter alpinus TaxID=2014873 RepID=A0A402BDG9_9CHLR|nr:carbohydrate ABC transporter permease [Dictyobacter alpinus]GCE29317.1 hypothetical protein KDA_48010 [Dictyobacter alpinus]